MAFPGTTTGLVFACVESFGGFFNFAAEPLISRVAAGEIEIFYWTTLGLAIALLLVNGITFPIAFKSRPQWMQTLDKERSDAKALTGVINTKPVMSNKTEL